LVAAADGRTTLALGNVVGSNIANIGLILGLSALVAPPFADGSMARRELLMLLVATVAPFPMLLDGTIGRLEGFALLAGAVWFLRATVGWSRARDPEPPSVKDAGAQGGRGRVVLALLVVAGLGVLLTGGKLIVVSAVHLALLLGISERLIGLTVVAIGTSLPELAAALVAAVRGHSDLCIGNVVGSNILNVLLVLGATAAVHPVAGSLAELGVDLGVMGTLTLFAFVSLRTKRCLTRAEGALWVMMYGGFVAFLVAFSAR
jgi:cation:H+ antiporter